ncbi:MAG: VanZ family protein [Coriobacteriales bacterium]|nr:VanZ family protein [Coriobacteriales bacterium]
MIEIPFLAGETIFTLIWLIVRLVVWTRNSRIDWRREGLLLLMYINLAVLIRITFFPMTLIDGNVQPLIFDPATAYPFRINLVPFVRLNDYVNKQDMILNCIGNISMFIPSGIILPIVYKHLNNFWKVVGVGVLISLGIEILQLPFSVRASDIDDLIMNITGVIIGYGIYLLAQKVRQQIKSKT